MRADSSRAKSQQRCAGSRRRSSWSGSAVWGPPTSHRCHGWCATAPGCRSSLWGSRIPVWCLTCKFLSGIMLWLGSVDAMVWSLLYSLTRNTLGELLLRVRGDAAKEVEILVLRHQLAVLRRQIERPALEPADRVLLAALSRFLPRRRWNAFIVTPGNGVAVAPRIARQEVDLSAPEAGTTTGVGRDPPAGAETGRRNPSWTQTHPQRLLGPGYQIGVTTVWRILHRAGVDRAPQNRRRRAAPPARSP